ncbi:MAG: hypothetical protein KDD64_04750 [Bdellovibrionales bacterium]|nr:hypothetical protein [Bdellovibrionales bacterium]
MDSLGLTRLIVEIEKPEAVEVRFSRVLGTSISVQAVRLSNVDGLAQERTLGVDRSGIVVFSEVSSGVWKVSTLPEGIPVASVALRNSAPAE